MRGLSGRRVWCPWIAMTNCSLQRKLSRLQPRAKGPAIAMISNGAGSMGKGSIS